MKSNGPGLVILLVTMMGFAAHADNPFSSPGQPLDSQPVILPVDEAFHFGHYVEGQDLKIFWQVLPGYFLYRDKFEYAVDDMPVAVEMAPGALYQDVIFGEVQVLEGLVEVTLENAGSKSVEVRYQGCAALGYCYPPQKVSINSEKITTSP